MRKSAVVGGVTAAVLVAGAAGAGLWWRHTEAEKELDRAARDEVAAFATSWSGRSFSTPGLRFTGSTSDVVAGRRAVDGLAHVHLSDSEKRHPCRWPGDESPP